MPKQTPNSKLERYETLLHDFARHIYSFCYSHTTQTVDAQALAQEVMEAVWNGIDDLRSTTPRQTNRWLQQVMRTTLAARLRKRTTLATVPIDNVGDVPAENHDDEELLRDLVAHLSLDEQRLVSRRLEGYTSAEIAASEGVSVDVVNHRMMRIKHKLRVIYDKLYGTDKG